MIDIDLAYMSASLQLDLFRARKLSPVEVLQAQITRHERHNDAVNATTYTHFEKAMDEARASEARWMNGTARPLEGVTCALKDEHHEAGMVVTAGSALLKDAVRDYTDEVTAKLKQAGVVVHMQTTVPEFYVHGVTFSRLWGVTRNPWNLNYTVGGSSGGTGAAIAAGMTTIGTGSDMGGSVRLPSAYCGLYGFKPPFGRITTEQPLSPFAGTGPMARTFADMTRMQNAMAGQTPHAPFTLPGAEMPLSYGSIEGMRIALSPDLGGFAKISDEMRALTLAAAERLSALGAEVVEIDLDLGSDLAEMTEAFFKVFWSGSMGGGLAAAFAERLEDMSPYARWAFKVMLGGKYGGAQQAMFEAYLRALHGRIADQLWNNGFDALVQSTLNDSHVPADFDHSFQTFSIDGVEMPQTFFASLSLPWNILNTHPVVSAPSGLTTQNMPAGIQIVAKPYDDMTAFRIAHAYEGATEPMFAGDRCPDFRR